MHEIEAAEHARGNQAASPDDSQCPRPEVRHRGSRLLITEAFLFSTQRRRVTCFKKRQL